MKARKGESLASAPGCVCVRAGTVFLGKCPFPPCAACDLDKVRVAQRECCEVQGEKKSLPTWLQEAGTESKRKKGLSKP